MDGAVEHEPHLMVLFIRRRPNTNTDLQSLATFAMLYPATTICNCQN
jgi:hypothetical protein